MFTFKHSEKIYERKSAILTIQKITYQQRNTQKENGMTYEVSNLNVYLIKELRHFCNKTIVNFVFFVVIRITHITAILCV